MTAVAAACQIRSAGENSKVDRSVATADSSVSVQLRSPIVQSSGVELAGKKTIPISQNLVEPVSFFFFTRASRLRSQLLLWNMSTTNATEYFVAISEVSGVPHAARHDARAHGGLPARVS